MLNSSFDRSLHAMLYLLGIIWVTPNCEAQELKPNQGFPEDMLLRISTNTIMEGNQVLYFLGEEKGVSFNELMEAAEKHDVQEEIWKRAQLVQQKMHELDTLCMDVVEQIDRIILEVLENQVNSLTESQQNQIKQQADRKGPLQLYFLNWNPGHSAPSVSLLAKADSILADFHVKFVHVMCDYSFDNQTYFFPEVSAENLMQSHGDEVFMATSINEDEKYIMRRFNQELVVARKMLTFSKMAQTNFELASLLFNVQRQVLILRMDALGSWRQKVGSVIPR